MKSPFEEREKSFEAKWVRDAEWRFKVFARRNKLLGLWAAAEMGVKGNSAHVYAAEIVGVDFAKARSPGDEGDDVFVKIRGDFDTNGIALSDHMIRRKMEELLRAADEQIQAELRR
jgi:hypothetical protein